MEWKPQFNRGNNQSIFMTIDNVLKTINPRGKDEKMLLQQVCAKPTILNQFLTSKVPIGLQSQSDYRAPTENPPSTYSTYYTLL